ncbi:uncharacterized protein LOC134527896 isoform X2 [Bacillus rossius redtenbacheri]|uniref:uncharacterized protein LOC134527896 isoform X2 n=1 Tax=Bacillus rossius redtenbacheri TaxID=93214 RepID=UPI002FDE43AE
MSDSQESTLQFIEDYRKHELLWNTSLKEYKNKQLRRDAIIELGRKYGLNEKAVKNKIKSLRCYFSKEHDKVCSAKSGMSANAKEVPSWFAYKSLLFLKDTAVPFQTVDSIDDSTNNDDNNEMNMMEGGVPRPRGRLLHFSDGTLEDHSSDEEHSTDEERPNEVPVDPKTLTWRPWMWYYVSTAGCKTLQVCDYLGESLAHFFGITSPKYQYEIEEYYRAKAEEEEYKKKQDLEMRGWLEKPTGVKVEEPLSVSRVEQADGNRAENIGELTTLL